MFQNTFYLEPAFSTISRRVNAAKLLRHQSFMSSVHGFFQEFFRALLLAGDYLPSQRYSASFLSQNLPALHLRKRDKAFPIKEENIKQVKPHRNFLSHAPHLMNPFEPAH